MTSLTPYENVTEPLKTEHASSNDPESPCKRDDDLPKNFDVLIIGTGLVESIVSAAVSRNGHSVLHIDPRNYYGGVWGTFCLQQWTSAGFMEIPNEEALNIDVTLKESCKGKIESVNLVDSFQQVWYDDRVEVKEELMKQKRRFNIDLMPKIIAAKEDIIQLLISSDVSRYLEFLRVSGLLTSLPAPNETKIETIPLSRADIFTSKSLSLVEKRNLVKFIEAVLKPNASSEEEVEPKAEAEPSVHVNAPEKTFEELVKISKATDKLRHMVKSVVTILDDGFCPDGERFNQEFCSRCRLFLNSIGRYGNQTPFLWTLYGISEICQAFCRLSAVYGGIFILNRFNIKTIDAVGDGFLVKTLHNEVKVKHIVLAPETTCDIDGKDENKKEQTSVRVGRAVLITKGGNIKAPDESLKSKGDGIFLYRISGLEIIELSSKTQSVPKDYHLLHVSFPMLEDNIAESHCKTLVEKVLSQFVEFEPNNPEQERSNPDEGANCPDDTSRLSDKPVIIYGSYFTLMFKNDHLISNLLVSEGGDGSKFCMTGTSVASTDLTSYVTKAREIFSSLYPGEEFLPKPPANEENEDLVNTDGEVAGHDSPSQSQLIQGAEKDEDCKSSEVELLPFPGESVDAVVTNSDES